ncbi:TPA: antiterminator Q family protein [Yersinia enterocolitica]|nr:antitermination protein Q [Yersinia enterocolitica]HDL8088233.1 antitermination protein Q [Yersinia enterocolitica]HDL8091661.1 antitermination protein Q [Yersinia enterocolitica]HDL8568777.1 antitermination protein Q [Yersinia enterocolitica]HDL8570235.1 antitermination protein Q [Yersinia enterocolitica]
MMRISKNLPIRQKKPRRNIQLVLERWGVWAKDNSGIDYSSIAAGFKGLLPYTTPSRPSCCDDDGLAVDGCVSRLKRHRHDEWELVIRHYVYNQSKRAIARQQKKDERAIRINLQMAEGFVDGCLAMMDICLEMDIEIQN